MDEIDRILSSEEAVAPTAGFASRVMAGVRTEGAAPSPLPFPWLRLAVGLGLCAGLIAALALVSPWAPSDSGGEARLLSHLSLDGAVLRGFLWSAGAALAGLVGALWATLPLRQPIDL
jgi:hypothetical protein